MRTTSLRLGLVPALAFLAVAGCSLEPKRSDSTLMLDLTSLARQAFEDGVAASGAGWSPRAGFAAFSGSSVSSFAAAPTTLAGFSCFGVNVVGPGIADTSRHPEGGEAAARLAEMLAGKSCAYRGIVAGPIFASANQSQEISLTIPSGPQRIIQLIGLSSSTECVPGSFAQDDDGVPGGGGGDYELGRAVTDLFDSRSVEINTAWNSMSAAEQAAKIVNCGEACTAGEVNGGNAGSALDTASTQANVAKYLQVDPATLTSVDLYMNNTSASAKTVYVSLRTSTTGASAAAPLVLQPSLANWYRVVLPAPVPVSANTYVYVTVFYPTVGSSELIWSRNTGVSDGTFTCGASYGSGQITLSTCGGIQSTLGNFLFKTRTCN